ncbi:MAG: GEVED domain-containing protein, partial [Saprospiraceae bacterium]
EGVWKVTYTDPNGCTNTANFTVNVNPVPCNADAGSATPNNPNQVITNTNVTLTATVSGQNRPNGFQVIYVLTKGNGLVIQATNSRPSFMVNETGKFTIHPLVYNPNTLDLSIVIPGQTTGVDVNSLLIQGGGDICASLLVNGAMFNVTRQVDPCADGVDLRQFISVDGGGFQERNSVTVCSGARVLLDFGGEFSNEWQFEFKRPDGRNFHGGTNGVKRDQILLPTVNDGSVNEGVWKVTYTNPAGCSNTENFTVNVNSIPKISSITKTDETCAGKNGSITFKFADDPARHEIEFSINGGRTWPAAYNVEDNTGSFTINNLAPGAYDLRVRWGNNECPVDLPDRTIGADPLPNVTSITKTDKTCDGNNGSITFNFTDNPARHAIEFSINGGRTWPAAYNVEDNTGSFTINNLAPGTYDLRVRWGNNECPVDLPDRTVKAETCAPCTDEGGDSDGDGVCNNEDCQPNNPNFPATPGATCNDGNPNTTNDRVTANACGCEGTPVTTCDNITNGGKIGFGGLCVGTLQICDPSEAPVIGNCTSASGGSGGAVEYLWLKNEVDCAPIAVTIADIVANSDVSNWKIVSGATNAAYNPGNVNVSTCYLRCARRPGCDRYTGEANVARIEVRDDCNETTSNLTVSCPNDITVTQTSTNGARVNWNEPTATTTCASGVSIIQFAGLSNGAVFPVGTSRITYTISDQCGSSRECGFNIIVQPSDTNGENDENTNEYCSAKGTSPWHQWITNVRVGSINRTSGKGGYANFTTERTDATRGQDLAFTLTPGVGWGEYELYWRIYIDWNQDGDFSDADELAFERQAGEEAVSGDISVPTAAQIGATRMRITMQRNAYADACGDFANGEVEDYTVVIKGNSPTPLLDGSNGSNWMYPNPAQSVVNVDLTTVAEQSVVVTILDNTGRVVQQQQFDYAPAGTTALDVSQLAGGIYLVQIKAATTHKIERLSINR